MKMRIGATIITTFNLFIGETEGTNKIDESDETEGTKGTEEADVTDETDESNETTQKPETFATLLSPSQFFA